MSGHTIGLLSHLLALGVLTTTGGSALAASLAVHGHWTVLPSVTACAALNRPPEEFNVAPFNALSIRQRRGAQPVLQVFVWPNVFKPGQAVTITMSIDSTRIDLPAEAGDSYFAEAKGPLPADLLALLRGARVAEVKVTGVPQPLLFDISQLEAVLASLDACERQLPKT
jgi:hypothetical protein